MKLNVTNYFNKFNVNLMRLVSKYLISLYPILLNCIQLNVLHNPVVP